MSSEITEKLHKIHFRGNMIGGPVNIIVCSVAIYFLDHTENLDHELIWPWVMVALGAVIRIISTFFRPKVAQIIGTVSSLLLGVGWAFYFYIITQFFGLRSIESSYALLIIAGVVNAAGSSYRANIKHYFLFSSPLALLLALCFLSSKDESHRFMVYFIATYYFINVYLYLVSHKQLMRSIKSEVYANEEKDRFRSLVNSVPGYVAILDENLVYVDANEMSLKFYPEMLGREVGKGNTVKEVVEFIKNFAASHKEFDIQEIASLHKGNPIYFMITIQRTKNGGYVIVSMPMDELVAARNELRIQEAKAQYAAKLASLGEMAAGIAHEVNNPLTILQGFASIIEQLTHQEPLDKENIRLLSGKLVHTTERISKIVKSLKSLSRNGDNDPFERVSIQTVIKEALDICGHRFKQNNIELKLPELDKDVFVKGREVQLGQVVLNLLVNAFDAVSGSDNGDKWVEVKLDSLHQGVSIDIIDSGPGVSIENAKKIMEPFFTTKDVGQGTGLGLSISKNIIEEHGGELFLIQNSKATTFRIQLPLV